MSTELTVQNFSTKIKSMNELEQKKIRAKELIQIILKVPDDNFAVKNSITVKK